MNKTTLIASVLFAALLLPSLASGDLVDYYKFEGNGTDSQGGDANGTPGASVGAGNWAAGYDGQAFFNVANIEGGNDTLQNANAINVLKADAFAPGSGSFSISLWVKHSNTGDTDWGDGILDSLTDEGYLLNFQTEGTLRFKIRDSAEGDMTLEQTTPLTDTTGWHHYAAVMNRATNTATIYFDGAADGSANYTLTGTTNPGENLHIGFNYLERLDGGIDELQLYDHALSLSEVQTLANVPEPATMSLLAFGGVAMLRRRKK